MMSIFVPSCPTTFFHLVAQSSPSPAPSPKQVKRCLRTPGIDGVRLRPVSPWVQSGQEWFPNKLTGASKAGNQGGWIHWGISNLLLGAQPPNSRTLLSSHQSARKCVIDVCSTPGI